MFFSELKKHFGKFQIIVLLVLLFGNLLIPAVAYRAYFTGKHQIITAQKKELLGLYRSDPDEYERILENHAADRARYEHEKTVSLMRYDGRAEVSFPNRYLFYPDYGDIELFRDVESILRAPDSYRSAVSDVLRSAALRLKSASDPDAYMSRYYEKLIRVYDPFFEASLPVSMVEGWNEFFSLKTPLVFTLLASLILFSGVFPLEHKTGMRQLLAVSKRGRGRLTLVKLGAVTAGSACLTAVFTLSPLLVFAASSCLTDAAAPVQLLEGFTFCWLRWSIGEYLFFLTAFRVIYFCVFSVAVTVIGQYAQNELASVIFTAAALFSGVVMERILPDSPVSYLRKFSPTLLADGQILFEKYDGVDLFSRCVGYAAFTVFCLGLFWAVLFAVSLSRRHPPRLMIKREKKKAPSGGYSLSLVAAEFYKILICRKGLLVLLAALTLRGIGSWIYFSPATDMTEAFFKNYMTVYEGEITQEKLDRIAAEGEEMRGLLNSYAEMRDKHNGGMISDEEYREYESRYTTAKYSEEAYKELCGRRDYLLRAGEKRGGIEFLYDEGITRFLRRPYDVISALVILFFSHALFPSENDANIASVIECARYGRRKLTKTKLFCVMSVAAAQLFCTTAIDLYFLTANYDPVNLSAAIGSIPFFEAVKADMSIKEYLILYQCMAILGYAVCWGTCILIGASAKTSRKSLAVLILTLFLPYLTSVLGTEVFAWVNYARITAPAIVGSAVPTLICMALIDIHLVSRNRRYFGR